MFSRAFHRLNALPLPNTADTEERAFLIEVALSAYQETQEQQGALVLLESPSAACAAASTRVSLSENEDETVTTLETMKEIL